MKVFSPATWNPVVQVVRFNPRFPDAPSRFLWQVILSEMLLAIKMAWHKAESSDARIPLQKTGI